MRDPGIDDRMVRPIDQDGLPLRIGAPLRRADISPKKRLPVANPVLYVAENGCKWRRCWRNSGICIYFMYA